MTLKFELKSAYGVTRFYPICKTSKALCDVAKRQAFTYDIMRELFDAGFALEYKDKRGETKEMKEETWTQYGTT